MLPQFELLPKNMSTKLSTFRCNKLYTAGQESSGWTKQWQPSPISFLGEETHKAPNQLVLGTIKSSGNPKTRPTKHPTTCFWARSRVIWESKDAHNSRVAVPVSITAIVTGIGQQVTLGMPGYGEGRRVAGYLMNLLSWNETEHLDCHWKFGRKTTKKHI